MSAGAGIRRFHRWVSMAFTLAVIANFVVRAQRGGNPPDWVTYAPLPPLALLLLTGCTCSCSPTCSGVLPGLLFGRPRAPRACRPRDSARCALPSLSEICKVRQQLQHALHRR